MARELTTARKITLAVLVPLVAFLMRMLWKSFRIEIQGEHYLKEAVGSGQPVIPCYWHQQDLPLSVYLLTHRVEGFKAAFLVSPSMDGEIAARIVESFGGQVLRGSATRTGAKAMRDLYLAISQQGLSPANTPDGSRGPIYEFKPGAVMISQMSGVPMLPLACAASHAMHLNTWDKFMIPMPFSRVTIKVGAPVVAAKKAAGGDVDETSAAMQQALNDLTRDCQELLLAKPATTPDSPT